MASTSSGGQPARALVLLERTAEDEAAGVFRVQARNGSIAQLTARQMEIISMPMDMKKFVPLHEQVELGKIVMKLQDSDFENVLREMDENPRQAPEFTPEPYEYIPLAKPTSLRLLEIVTEDEDGMLHISLDEYDLDQHIPSYSCLSYCWGNPHVKSNTFSRYDDFAEEYDESILYPLSCNGRLLYVRQNLYDALKQLPEAPGLQVKTSYEFNGSPELMTDFQIAVADGDVNLTKTNIFRGADINIRDSQGRTALTLAVIKGHLPMVKTLLEAGIDPQLQDYHNLAPLDYALQYERHEITDYMLTFDPSSSTAYKRKNRYIGQAPKLWIDAICINQADLKEKNEQVSVMDRIYSQASYVTIWLGRDDGTGADAASIVYKLYSIVILKDNLADTGIVPYQPTSEPEQSALGLPWISPKEWYALLCLYLRQHFRRIWCLQEAVLPDRIVMYMGKQEIPWSEFMMVTEQLHMLQKQYTVAPSTSFRPTYTAPIESEAHLISELRMRRQLDGVPAAVREDWFRHTGRLWRGEGRPCQVPLLEMISSTTTFECFDPRDHIYALIGMCKHHPESPKIDIDYARPYEEIYTDIMRLFLNQFDEPSLEAVGAIKDSALSNNENLPGWVVHFGQPGITPIWERHLAAAGQESFTFDLKLSSSGRENELVLEGQRIDVIDMLATKRAGAGQVSMFDFDCTWPGLVLSLPATYPHTNEARTEVLWRTLCADQPSKDDIRASRTENMAKNESTSTEELSVESKAPSKYGAQFRDQLCASMLSYAEKAADWHLKYKLSRSGVLLQAMVALEIQREANSGDGSVHRIMAPSNEEVARMRDTSLNGPYFEEPAASQALDELEQLYNVDSTSSNGPGCATPSRAEIAAFLANPPFRVWRPNKGAPAPEVSIIQPGPAHGSETQYLDRLPAGQDGFRMRFSVVNGGRRLFVTRQQKYLGIGGMSMEPGDEIWVVKGSKVPFLLRKMGEDEAEEDNGGTLDNELSTKNTLKGKGKARAGRTIYRYIGDLYVHGMMKGEAVNRTADWEEIVLS